MANPPIYFQLNLYFHLKAHLLHCKQNRQPPPNSMNNSTDALMIAAPSLMELAVNIRTSHKLFCIHHFIMHAAAVEIFPTVVFACVLNANLWVLPPSNRCRAVHRIICAQFMAIRIENVNWICIHLIIIIFYCIGVAIESLFCFHEIKAVTLFKSKG